MRLDLGRGDLSTLPPTLVITNECDTLRDEGETLAEQIHAAGGEATVRRSAGLAHDVYLLSGAVFRAQEQRAAAGEFLVTQLAQARVLAGA